LIKLALKREHQRNVHWTDKAYAKDKQNPFKFKRKKRGWYWSYPFTILPELKSITFYAISIIGFWGRFLNYCTQVYIQVSNFIKASRKLTKNSFSSKKKVATPVFTVPIQLIFRISEVLGSNFKKGGGGERGDEWKIIIKSDRKPKMSECESESEENITSVFALAPTLALFSVPRTDKSCNYIPETLISTVLKSHPVMIH